MFYTYLWLREDGTPYYVGKGSGNRAYKDHRIGKAPLGRIVIYPADSEADAFESEIALIWYHGRKDLGLGCLRNFSNGGDGPSGAIRSSITRAKLRVANLGKPQTQKTKNKRSVSLRKPWSVAKRLSNAAQPRITPTCHPDRKHKAHGLCKPCAYKEWVKNNGIRSKR
jgi:hypothetical protein